MEFKAVLSSLLADKKFSVLALAEFIGVLAKSVYDRLNGKFEPNKKRLPKIAGYFGITERDLRAKLWPPEPEAAWIKIPVPGEVPAGNPVEENEQLLQYFSIPACPIFRPGTKIYPPALKIFRVIHKQPLNLR